MRGLIRSPKDFWTGMIYLVAGATALWIARDYSFGTAARMGPGYFPTVICVLLIVFGVFSILRALRVDGEPIAPFAFKAAFLVTGSVVAFGLLLPSAGLPIAMVVLVLMAAAASARFKFEVLPLVGLVALVVFCSVVFVIALGVPMPLAGTWLAALAPG